MQMLKEFIYKYVTDATDAVIYLKKKYVHTVVYISFAYICLNI